MAQFYVAVLEANSAGEIFVFVPDLPGVTAAAGTEHEALTLAIEFANDYVRDLAGGRASCSRTASHDRDRTRSASAGDRPSADPGGGSRRPLAQLVIPSVARDL
jgi:hypothetical protein